MAAAEANAVAPSLATALYVGDLDGSVTEEELSRLFSEAGEVVSVKLCFDEINQRSLGYGYVNYKNPDDAEKALEQLNFSRLNGKCIRIAYSNRDGRQRKSGHGNVFVKNLDRAIDHKALHGIFSPFGKIISCKVESDSRGESKGYGYVQFKNEEDANRAMKNIHGTRLYEKEVYAVPYVSKQEREMSADKIGFTNVYVKNMSASTDEADLRSVFGEFGAITSVVVMRDGGGKSKCFGFVNFERAEDAARSVEVVNGREFDGMEWYVGRAQKKAEREVQMKLERERMAKEAQEMKNNVYIKNIDDGVGSEKLKEMFSPFGTITSCKVMTDARGINRGYGFVAFSRAEEASRAIAEMNGKMVGSKPLYVNIAERKDVRQQRLQSVYSANVHPAAMMVPPQIPRPPPIVYGNIPQPGLMFEPRFVPAVPILPSFLFPMNLNMIQRPAGPHIQPPPFPVMHPEMPLMGFRSLNGSTSQGATSASLPHATALANASPSEQKRILAESLYPLVEKMEPEMANKVTGMLLEMDQTEILHLLESPESLKSRVEEAMDVIANATPSQRMGSMSLNQ